ncbi:hypothetical protein [Cupriavidus basilensis]|uniref:hypothetical protein n=1 Tax=Cupriavidus basilensis TaxID=68895 RepID=UPI0020A656C6|nr:hypothetical protein [Cupriavidus basilensis]MCP3024980.1 hypothetical protein [Cupriavidus basilensis]
MSANFRIVENEDGDGVVRELRIDGEYIATWNAASLREEHLWIVESALQYAFEHGKRVRSREIKALIG